MSRRQAAEVTASQEALGLSRRAAAELVFAFPYCIHKEHLPGDAIPVRVFGTLGFCSYADYFAYFDILKTTGSLSLPPQTSSSFC